MNRLSTNALIRLANPSTKTISVRADWSPGILKSRKDSIDCDVAQIRYEPGFEQSGEPDDQAPRSNISRPWMLWREILPEDRNGRTDQDASMREGVNRLT